MGAQHPQKLLINILEELISRLFVVVRMGNGSLGYGTAQG